MAGSPMKFAEMPTIEGCGGETPPTPPLAMSVIFTLENKKRNRKYDEKNATLKELGMFNAKYH